MSYELNLGPVRLERDPQTKKWLAGHRAFNKGKKWSEFLSEDAQRRIVAAGTKRFREQQHPKNAGPARKRVVAILEDGTWAVYDSVIEAARMFGTHRGTISSICARNRRNAKNNRWAKEGTSDRSRNGVRFYYETDPQWADKIKR